MGPRPQLERRTGSPNLPPNYKSRSKNKEGGLGSRLEDCQNSGETTTSKVSNLLVSREPITNRSRLEAAEIAFRGSSTAVAIEMNFDALFVLTLSFNNLMRERLYETRYSSSLSKDDQERVLRKQRRRQPTLKMLEESRFSSPLSKDGQEDVKLNQRRRQIRRHMKGSSTTRDGERRVPSNLRKFSRVPFSNWPGSEEPKLEPESIFDKVYKETLGKHKCTLYRCCALAYFEGFRQPQIARIEEGENRTRSGEG